jgi:hypothetical protein
MNGRFEVITAVLQNLQVLGVMLGCLVSDSRRLQRMKCLQIRRDSSIWRAECSKTERFYIISTNIITSNALNLNISSCACVCVFTTIVYILHWFCSVSTGKSVIQQPQDRKTQKPHLYRNNTNALGSGGYSTYHLQFGTGSFPGVKRPRRSADHPPPSKRRGHESVELYLYSPSEPSWPVIGRILPFY